MKRSGLLFLVIALSAIAFVGFHAEAFGATYDCSSTCQVCHTAESATLDHPGGTGTPVMCMECHQQNRTMCSDTGLVHSGTPEIDIVEIACRGCHGPDTCGMQLTVPQLLTYATDIHNAKPRASFGYRLATPDTLTVNVDASGSSCGSSCASYSWNWGDNTANGTGATASHTYATGGAKTITLTVTKDSATGSVSRVVTVVAADLGPTVGGSCTFNPNTWIETVTDSSSDAEGVSQVTVNWGDGSMLSSDTAAPFGPFTHTYLKAGTFTLSQKAIDTRGQQSSRTCTVTPAYFTIGGTVKNRLGTANLANATVTIKKGTTTVGTVYTNASGIFTSAANLKPGTYTLTVTKSGYTFAVPAATITVGPSGNVGIISATAP